MMLSITYLLLHYVPIIDHAMCMADMAYVLARVGAWSDAEYFAHELLEGASEICPRAYPSIFRLASIVKESK
ncbi:hypothetical protein [Frankia sp. CcWB3]